MAKKTTSRSRSESAPDTGAPPEAPKPRAPRARSSSKKADIPVADDVAMPTDVSVEQVTGSASISMASEPSEEDIRVRAYQRYLERGGGHGMDFEDWLEAERELRRRR